MAKTLTAKMKFHKETKGTVVFNEVDAKGEVLDKRDPKTLIGSLYIRKGHFADQKYPNQIAVKVEL